MSARDCKGCSGRGYLNWAADEMCQDCNGTGEANPRPPLEPTTAQPEDYRYKTSEEAELLPLPLQILRLKEINEELCNTHNTLVIMNANAESALAAMREDRDLWQDAHDEDCPNKAALEEMRAELDQYKRKLALIFDNSTYGDSYGVEGSSFSVCRWCSGGSGPGGSAPFKHNDGCLMDDDALEAKCAEVWEEFPELRKEADELRAERDRAQDALRVVHAKIRQAGICDGSVEDCPLCEATRVIEALAPVSPSSQPTEQSPSASQ